MPTSKSTDYFRYGFALFALTILVWGYNHVSENDSFARHAGYIVVLGAAFGILLQRSRFCFFCILRDFFDKKDGRPLVGILVALLTGSIGYLVIFGTWVTDPLAGYLPQDAHIGPVSWALILGGLTFGWGMVLSGSCISAHLYRLGEGSTLSPIALAGTFFGFILGFKTWNWFYLSAISTSSVVWTPAIMGYTGSLLLQSAVLITLILWLLIKYSPSPKVRPFQPLSLSLIYERVFVKKWPEWLAGIGVGILGFFAYFRVEPIGVTAEIGRLSRNTGNHFEIIPTRLEGLDGFAGCATADTAEVISSNGIFILALVAGALVTGLLSGRFRPEVPRLTEAGKALIGGVLLGFGAMISLGCTVGNTLSGISAFAVSGWVFTIAMVFAVWSGLRLGKLISGKAGSLRIVD